MKSAALVFLILFTACGNPHLISNKSHLNANLPLIAQPDDLQQDFNLLRIETDQGETELKVTNINSPSSPSQKLTVINQNDTEMELSYRFLDGTHFKFNGGNFPGVNGSCLENAMISLEKCDLDILFTADDEGVYQDKLIVEFKPKDSTLPTKTIEFPLIGERKNTTLLAPKVTVTTLTGESSLNFGPSLIMQDIKSELVVKNIGNTDVLIDVILEGATAFTVTGGTCAAELKKGQECTLEVTFNQNPVGLYSDNTVLTYRPVTSPVGSGTKIKTPVYGEKKDINVGNPRPGKLVASEIMGDLIDFGTITLGSKTAKQVEITNIGDLSVEIKDLQFIGNDSFSFNGGSFPGLRGTCEKIVLRGNCILDIQFKPSALGEKTGSLKITTKDNKELVLKLIGKAKEADICYTTDEVLISPVTKAKANPKDVIFPYNSKAAGTTSTLDTIYGTEVNGYYSALDMYTVKDSQVYVQYQVPALTGKVVSINFGVSVQKVVLDNFKDTESLCLSTDSVRKCSGQQFALESWQKLLNKNFWDQYETPVNGLYTEQFDKSAFNCGGKECMRLKKVYDLESIFELSEKEMQSVVNGKKISLVFSDDTRMLSLPKLLVKTMKKVECK